MSCAIYSISHLALFFKSAKKILPQINLQLLTRRKNGDKIYMICIKAVTKTVSCFKVFREAREVKGANGRSRPNITL